MNEIFFLDQEEEEANDTVQIDLIVPATTEGGGRHVYLFTHK